MFSRINRILIGLALASLFAGCSREANRAGGKEYDIEGKIVAIAPDGAAVTIDHKAIVGLMGAMEMKFGVADAEVLKGLKAGDSVKGRLRVQDGAYTILRLQKIAETAETKGIRENLAKLSGPDMPLAESQRLYPITGQPLGSLGVPAKLTIQGETVFLCCESCDGRAKADAAKTLANAKSFRDKN